MTDPIAFGGFCAFVLLLVFGAYQLGYAHGFARGFRDGLKSADSFSRMKGSEETPGTMDTVETERSLEVLRIAEADLQRRLKEMSPQVDLQIQETLHICEQRLKEAGESSEVGKQFLVTESSLRQLILDYSPLIRYDTNRMAEMIREIVDLEREKAGLGRVGGKGTLHLVANRENPKAPDFSGIIPISGKSYQVRAYVGVNQQFINLTFCPA